MVLGSSSYITPIAMAHIGVGTGLVLLAIIAINYFMVLGLFNEVLLSLSIENTYPTIIIKILGDSYALTAYLSFFVFMFLIGSTPLLFRNFF